MNKVSKQSVIGQTVRTNRRYPTQQPEVINIDDLAVLTDEELNGLCYKLDSERQKVIDAYLDPRPWEEELAYIKREMQVRRARREAHDRYVRQLEREFAESEANLPVADLDNSRFTKLVEEMN